MNPAIGLERLVEGLDRLEIPYMVAGSAASSAHGIWRATADVDLVARIDEDNIRPLVEEFTTDFYIDASQIEKASASFKVPLTFKAAAATHERLSIALTNTKEKPQEIALTIAWGKFELAAPVQARLEK